MYVPGVAVRRPKTSDSNSNAKTHVARRQNLSAVDSLAVKDTPHSNIGMLGNDCQNSKFKNTADPTFVWASDCNHFSTPEMSWLDGLC